MILGVMKITRNPKSLSCIVADSHRFSHSKKTYLWTCFGYLRLQKTLRKVQTTSTPLKAFKKPTSHGAMAHGLARRVLQTKARRPAAKAGIYQLQREVHL